MKLCQLEDVVVFTDLLDHRWSEKLLSSSQGLSSVVEQLRVDAGCLVINLDQKPLATDLDGEDHFISPQAKNLVLGGMDDSVARYIARAWYLLRLVHRTTVESLN
jgi:hypothetical protein